MRLQESNRSHTARQRLSPSAGLQVAEGKVYEGDRFRNGTFRGLEDELGSRLNGDRELAQSLSRSEIDDIHSEQTGSQFLASGYVGCGSIWRDSEATDRLADGNLVCHCERWQCDYQEISDECEDGQPTDLAG